MIWNRKWTNWNQGDGRLAVNKFEWKTFLKEGQGPWQGCTSNDKWSDAIISRECEQMVPFGQLFHTYHWSSILREAYNPLEVWVLLISPVIDRTARSPASLWNVGENKGYWEQNPKANAWLKWGLMKDWQ